MLISTAFAQGQEAAPAPGGFGQMLIPLVLIAVIFYFLLIRPQQKRMKQHREMVNAVRRGDTVVTSGGLIGKVARVSDDEIQVDLGEGTKVRVVKSTIAEVRSKTEPAESSKE